MKPMEQLLGWTGGLTQALFAKLDRNFRVLAQELVSETTTLNGYTLKHTDQIQTLFVDATAGALTVYLPDQPVGGRRRTIMKSDASANAVTVDGNGNNINGAGTSALAAQYDSITVEADGTQWWIIAST